MFYFMSMRLILKRRRAEHWRQNDKLLLMLNIGLILMITIYLMAQNFFGEEMWVINEGYPGGSGQYYADHAAVWYQTMGSAASVVLSLMSDAFLVRYFCVLSIVRGTVEPPLTFPFIDLQDVCDLDRLAHDYRPFHSLSRGCRCVDASEVARNGAVES